MSSHGDPNSDRYSSSASPAINQEITSPPAFAPIFSSHHQHHHHHLHARPEPGPSLKRPGSPLLRKTQSFKLDEGYGEGAEESQSFQDSHLDSQDTARDGYSLGSPSGVADVKVPDWMMELSDDVRK
ncbi:hypothetical protein H072_3282, partial [Dactylellina haptotyla CBS 200.50]